MEPWYNPATQEVANLFCGLQSTEEGYWPWDSQEHNTPSVLYNSVPTFRNPDTGLYHNFLMSFEGQHVAWYSYPTEPCPDTTPPGQTYGSVGIAFSDDGLSWVPYSGNPVLLDTNLATIVGPGSSIVNQDIVYVNENNVWAIYLIGLIPSYLASQPNTPGALGTTLAYVLKSTDAINWELFSEVSPDGIIDPYYPSPYLYGARLSVQTDGSNEVTHIYMTRSYSTHFTGSNYEALPNRVQLYRMRGPMSNIGTGTWKLLADVGCSDPGNEADYQTSSLYAMNEGNSIESDGFGRVLFNSNLGITLTSSGALCGQDHDPNAIRRGLPSFNCPEAVQCPDRGFLDTSDGRGMSTKNAFDSDEICYTLPFKRIDEMTEERFLNVFMDQNNKCNLSCRMCGFSDPRVKSLDKYDMPIVLFQKIASEVFPHASYLALSCLTEPLLSRDFPKRLDMLVKFPVPFVEIVTNATLLSSTMASAIIEAPVSRLAVSLDGASSATYESIRRGANFEKVIANLHSFNRLKANSRKDKPQLRLNHVLTEFNIHEFEAFLALAASLEAECIDVRTVTPFRNAGYEGSSSRKFFERVRKCKEMLTRWTEKTGAQDVGYLRGQFEEINLTDAKGEKLWCQQPWKSVAIHANGDAVPCITWTREPLGNLWLQSFEEIWEGEGLKRLRVEFDLRRPGLDCQYCTIRKDEPADVDDDCFYRMLSKSPPDMASSY